MPSNKKNLLTTLMEVQAPSLNSVLNCYWRFSFLTHVSSEKQIHIPQMYNIFKRVQLQKLNSPLVSVFLVMKTNNNKFKTYLSVQSKRKQPQKDLPLLPLTYWATNVLETWQFQVTTSKNFTFSPDDHRYGLKRTAR
jgi:hypothetical protein